MQLFSPTHSWQMKLIFRKLTKMPTDFTEVSTGAQKDTSDIFSIGRCC